MSRSRLPPPPARGGGRPLPPEPPAGESNDAPPPLPNRPSHGGKPHGGGRHPPPPIQNGGDGPVDDYLEPDDWSNKSGPPPVIPPKNFSPDSSEDEGMTYEEPDMPPPPPTSRHAPPPEPFEQETYDDLEDVQPEQIIDEPGETYDECDMKPAAQQQQQPAYDDGEQLYEEEPPSDDFPAHPEPAEEESDCLYEFMPENESKPSPPAPPPPSVHSRPHIPLPPQPNSAPSLPARPPPARPPDMDPSSESGPDLKNKLRELTKQLDDHKRRLNQIEQLEYMYLLAPAELPGRPAQNAKMGRKISSDGPQIGISLEQIGLKRANLKKVSSSEEPGVKPHQSVKKDESDASSDDSNTVKARINMFKQAEKGPKPFLPVKPTMSSAAIKPRNNCPPPVPPSKILGPPPPPPPYALCKKPGEVKSPPPVVKSPPPVVKYTPPPPVVKPAPPVSAPSFDECDDIYDEGFSYVPDPLSKEEWYHGEIERADATTRLKSIGQDGTFLVRKSKQGGDTQPYTLAVLYEGHVYNLKMRTRSDGQVALGEEKPDELAFKDVPALIQRHRNHDVILMNVKEKKQHKTLLKRHPINVNA